MFPYNNFSFGICRLSHYTSLCVSLRLWKSYKNNIKLTLSFIIILAHDLVFDAAAVLVTLVRPWQEIGPKLSLKKTLFTDAWLKTYLILADYGYRTTDGNRS